MRVLGVDPGLTRCGIGVVEGLPGRRLRMIEAGVIRTPVGDDPHERLLTLQTELDEWISRTAPDAIAVERVFAKANIKGIMGTAQASAVPMLAAARLGLPLGLHTPTEVKAAVTGHGRADKAQVTHMVTRILNLSVAPKPADAADALALAICHTWRSTSQARLATGQQAPENVFEAAERAVAVSGPNRLERLHAEHRTASRSALARASSGRNLGSVASRRVLPPHDAHS